MRRMSCGQVFVFGNADTRIYIIGRMRSYLENREQ